MYPAQFFALFPPFPREESVFVAMSFDGQFEARWKEVIAPAVGQIEVNGQRLRPLRVDTRKVSESILTEILSGVSNSRLVFADITTIGQLGGRAIRNSNVMYEVGLAHAVRLPEEVLLFRSDTDLLPFDTSNVRVNSYSPDTEPEKARNAIMDGVIAALRELDLRRHLAVGKAVESLDYPAWWALGQAQSHGGVAHPEMATAGQILGNSARAGAIARLLEMGAVRTRFTEFTASLLAEVGDQPGYPLLKYECTEFGAAVFNETAKRWALARRSSGRRLNSGLARKSAPGSSLFSAKQ